MKEKLTSMATFLEQHEGKMSFQVRIQRLEKLIRHQQRKIFTQKNNFKNL